MIKNQFQIGDTVVIVRRGLTGTVVEVQHQPEVNPALALKCRVDGSTGWGGFHLKETYLYRVVGEGIPHWWIGESLLRRTNDAI